MTVPRMLVQDAENRGSNIAAKNGPVDGETPEAPRGSGGVNDGGGKNDLEEIELQTGQITLGEGGKGGNGDRKLKESGNEKRGGLEGKSETAGLAAALEVVDRSRTGKVFLQELNECLFKEDSERSNNFPLKIQIEGRDGIGARVETRLSEEDLEMDSGSWVQFRTKAEADRVVRWLLEEKYDVSFNYNDFISHPGNLFIKNLSDELINYDKLFEYFRCHSKYNSLVDINIFNSVEDDVYAILKFQNYLDVDFICDTLDTSENPFNVKEGVPIYLNKYISKKERRLRNPDSSAVPDNLNNYNTIIIENLGDFVNGQDPELSLMEKFLSKFELFNPIDCIYFPVMNTDGNSFRLLNFGYINFELNDNLNINVLKCLYYLNNLSFRELMNFGPEDMYDMEQDMNRNESLPPTNRENLKISIGQHKHNHYLYQYQTNQLLFLQHHTLSIKFLDLSLHNNLLNSFSKYVNYQETNIYVNNFPIIFKNNDQLWEKFWMQFGSNVKSAKIIKPQFYSKRNEVELGKIGFVFYKDFRMALRAILLTNNKLINFQSFKKIFIQTSFAIQKNNHNHQRSSLPTNYFPAHNASNNYLKRFSLPVSNEYNYYLQPPHTVPTPTHMAQAPPSAPQMNPDYFNFYNPYMYPYHYPYMPYDKETSPSDASAISPPPSNYYYQNFYPSSNNFQSGKVSPSSPNNTKK